MKTNTLRYPLIATTLALLGVAAACSSGELLKRDDHPGTVTQAVNTSTIAPTNGPQGTSILVSGTGFTGGETVDITFDGTSVGSATADTSGAFTTSIDSPSSKPNGTYAVVSTGATSLGSASSNFTVDSSTPKWSLTPAASGFDGVPVAVKYSPVDTNGDRMYVATDKGPYSTDSADPPATVSFSNITGTIGNTDGVNIHVSGGMVGGVFFSAKLPGDGGAHLYRSQDAGSDWAAVTPNPDMEVHGWKIFYMGGTHLIGGTNGVVEKATNAYGSYPNQPPPTLGSSSCSVESIDGPSTTNVLAASYGCGMYRSTDGNGATWTARNGSLTTISLADQPKMRAVAIDPSSAGTFYAGSDDGTSNVLYKTTDSGGSWTAFGAGLTNRKVYAIAVHPTNHIAYVGTDDGLYKYDSGTSAFVLSGLSGTGARVTSISFSPTDPDKIFVSLNANKSLWYTTSGG